MANQELTRSHQAHAILRTERDDLASQLLTHQGSEGEWQSKHLSLSEQHSTLQEQLATVTREKIALTQEKVDLQAQVGSIQTSIGALQEKLIQAASELANNARQLHATQAELKNATRRADDAERTQKELQSEGTNLMRSLDEMRPKIVELTGVKLELGDRVENLENVVRSRDATIVQLESSLEEVRDRHEQAEKDWQTKIAQQKKDHSDSQKNATELQQMYADLQDELASALSSIRTLEANRSSSHQEAARRMEELTTLTASTLAQTRELEALRQEVYERRNNQVGFQYSSINHLSMRSQMLPGRGRGIP